MKISLKQLNEGFNALAKVAQTQFPKEHHKVSYKLSRIWKSAKSEVEEMQASLRDLMRKFGIIPGDPPDQVKLNQYAPAERDFLKNTEVELWGEPFDSEAWQVIIEVASLTPADLADLDWLVESEQEEPSPAGSRRKPTAPKSK